eukprot:9757586-Alexandrium_andersonii.AAC.1
MSASLVGSEMCIRDRHRSGHGLSVLPEGVASPPAGAVKPHCVGTAFSLSVSYTHLTLPTICSV